MSDIMKGVGLAHLLAEAFDHSEASFGFRRTWKDFHINALTTREGKSKVLGPMLDVLRGDAEIVPTKRIIDTHSVGVGDRDRHAKNDVSRVVLNRRRFGNIRIPRWLVLGEFKLGIASRRLSKFYVDNKDDLEMGRIAPKPETHVDVSDYHDSFTLNRKYLLPRFLLGKKLPGIALRNFYLENPQHIPEFFPSVVLFWGTICKNDWCYYVPGIRGESEYGRKICSYEVIDGEEVVHYNNFDEFEDNAVVFI